jgi:hypothetical protein
MVLSCAQEVLSTEKAPEAARLEVSEIVEVIEVADDTSPPEVDVPSGDAEEQVERLAAAAQ